MERQKMYSFQGRRKNKQKDGLCGSKLEYQQSLQTSHGLPILCIICGDLSIESQFSDTKWLPITDQPAWQHSQNSPILISVTINIIRIEYFLQNDSRALQWSPQPKQVTSRLTMLLGAHTGVSLPAQVIKRWRMCWCERALRVLECKLVWASDSLEPEIHVPHPFTGSTWPHHMSCSYSIRPGEVRLKVPISLLHGSLLNDQPQQAEKEMELSWKSVCLFPLLSGPSAKEIQDFLENYQDIISVFLGHIFSPEDFRLPQDVPSHIQTTEEEGRWEVQTSNLSGEKSNSKSQPQLKVALCFSLKIMPDQKELQPSLAAHPWSACNAGDLGLYPGSARSPGGGHGNPLQHLAWRIPWTEEPGGLQSMGSQRVK